MVRLFEAAKIIDPSATQRSTIGTMLQHPSVRPWERSMVWAIVSAIRPHWRGEWDESAQSTLDRYQAFIKLIHDLDLPRDIDRSPVLDVSAGSGEARYSRLTRQGKAVQGILNIKPSPVLSSILRAVNIWQLDHPQGTPEECETWLRSKWEAGEWAEEVAALAAKGEKRKR